MRSLWKMKQHLGVHEATANPASMYGNTQARHSRAKTAGLQVSVSPCHLSLFLSSPSHGLTPTTRAHVAISTCKPAASTGTLARSPLSSQFHHFLAAAVPLLTP